MKALIVLSLILTSLFSQAGSVTLKVNDDVISYEVVDTLVGDDGNFYVSVDQPVSFPSGQLVGRNMWFAFSLDKLAERSIDSMNLSKNLFDPDLDTTIACLRKKLQRPPSKSTSMFGCNFFEISVKPIK